MKTNKGGKLLIVFGIFLLGMTVGYVIKDEKSIKFVTVTGVDTTLVNQVKDLKEENKILLDELQLKEGEISYWGRKYDSLKHGYND